MTLSDYVPGNSFIHRLPSGIKILSLALVGTLLFVFPLLAVVLSTLVVVATLYPLAGIGPKIMLLQLKPLLWVLALLFAVQWWMVDWVSGVLVVARLSALLLLAALVTLTTRTTDMIDALESGLSWLRFLRINPAKVSLALSLALRFIPVLAAITTEVREAQKARGLDRSVIAVAIPVIVRTLKMADDIAAALEARAYDPQLKRPQSDAEKSRGS
ncbi:energy-coupling factor transporter transmembrane protein EcfT [Erwinia sp. INIA-01]|uniref:energy-coupling factor transporter transmembrane component T family protein n=1 Tax=Erwinia sp. INIA01 TaxID=2991500 RepID=UPI0022244223|nr:energy-coupling factor transporter transmembrane protein EcfT [Erwinia sp. INIA01]MCW1875527.1 energy-coupling factor transporter transmembrane protein EcfT [Erwinia sp. INIA01]